jgi:hypothetical protein
MKAFDLSLHHFVNLLAHQSPIFDEMEVTGGLCVREKELSLKERWYADSEEQSGLESIKAN